MLLGGLLKGRRAMPMLRHCFKVQQKATLATATATATSSLFTNMPKTVISTLDNGMKVATENSHHDTATIGVCIDAGSRFETSSTNGTAHFLEHMAFKGTKTRSQQQLEIEIENMGGSLNAYTSREQTVYYARVLKDDVPKAIDILSDILLNSVYEQESIERERHVILREKEEVEKNELEFVMDHLHAVAYQGTALGRTILGPTANIKSISRQDLVDYVSTNYIPSRMALVATGGVSHDQVLELSQKAFGAMPAATSPIAAPEKCAFTGSEVKIRDDAMDNTHIAIAVEGVPVSSSEYFPLMICQAILGGWDRSMAGSMDFASPLAKVVSQYNLCSSYSAFYTNYSDSGLFGLQLVTDRRFDIEDALEMCLTEWVRICVNVTDADVARAKAQLKASVLLNYDSTEMAFQEIGRQMLAYNGRRLSLEELYALIEAVDTNAVRDAASRHLYDRCPAVVGYGATAAMPDYNQIRVWMRSLIH